MLKDKKKKDKIIADYKRRIAALRRRQIKAAEEVLLALSKN